jgi:hypothetical protein
LKLENKNTKIFKQNQIRFEAKLDLKLKKNITKRTKQDAQKIFEKE